MKQKQEQRSPRLIKRGDIVQVVGMPEGVNAFVTGISVVLNLSNGVQQVHQLDEKVTVVTETDPDDELAIQAAEMLSRDD